MFSEIATQKYALTTTEIAASSNGASSLLPISNTSSYSVPSFTTYAGSSMSFASKGNTYMSFISTQQPTEESISFQLSYTMANRSGIETGFIKTYMIPIIVLLCFFICTILSLSQLFIEFYSTYSVSLVMVNIKLINLFTHKIRF